MGEAMAQNGEHDPESMVYRHSMTPVLVVLLLAAAPADAQVVETPVTPQAQADPEAARARRPARPRHLAHRSTPTPLPEATAPQGPAKPPAPRQQLKILAQDSRMEAYQQFRSLYETARFEEALPYAKRVVELSEQDAERDHELPIAYNNLGATQYQLADYTGANASYRNRSSCSRRRRAFPRGGSSCRSRDSAPFTPRRTSIRSRRNCSIARWP